MAGFDFWAWADPSEIDDLRAKDFERQAKESIQQADADLWARDAGRLLDQSRQQAGDMFGNLLSGVRSAVAEPVQQAADIGQKAAQEFGSWATDRLGDVRAKLPGYEEPSTTPEPSAAAQKRSENSGSPLLDAFNSHVAAADKTGGGNGTHFGVPIDQPFPQPKTTPGRDDWRQEWRPQLYQQTPNAEPPWSGKDRGTVNPGLAPLDTALRQGQERMAASPSNPNPGQSHYAGLYTDADQYGGNAYDRTPHQIGVNARDHLVGIMRGYWKETGGEEPTTDRGLSAIARQLTETLAHEVGHDTSPQHDQIQAAAQKKINQAEGAPTYEVIFNALRQMRDSGDLRRAVDTAKAGTSPNPDELSQPATAQASVSPLERSGANTSDQGRSGGSPLLDALNGGIKGFSEAAQGLSQQIGQGAAGISDAAGRLARGEVGNDIREGIGNLAGSIHEKASEPLENDPTRTFVLDQVEKSDLPEPLKFPVRLMRSADDIVTYLSGLLGNAITEPVRDQVVKPLLATIGAEKHVNLPVLGEVGTADLALNSLPVVGNLGGAARARMVPGVGGALKPEGFNVTEIPGIRQAAEKGSALLDALREHTSAMTRGLPGGAPAGAIVPPDEARYLGPTRIPPGENYDLLSEAVRSAGGKVLPDGIHIDLVRFQKPEMEEAPARRGGVFYSAEGGHRGNYVQTEGSFDESPGGPQMVNGPTVLRRPLVVDGYVEGDRKLYEQLGIQVDPQELYSEIVRARQSGAFGTPRERLEAIVQKYGGEPEAVSDIMRRQAWDEVPSALRENIISNHARGKGYDSIIGVRRDDLGKPEIVEIMDLREGAYPSPGGGYTLRPEFEPGGSLTEEANRLEAAQPVSAGGFLPSTSQSTSNLGSQALGGALAGGYSASQEEGATPESVARGAALGAVGGAARGALTRRGGGQVLARAVERARPETDRYYHGTASAFDTPDPTTFNEHGLVGPAYYMTSDSRVAGSGDLRNPGYAESQQGLVRPMVGRLERIATSLRERIAAQEANPEPGKGEFLIQMKDRLAEVERDLALNQGGPGPNIRAIDVPRDLNLLDIDAGLSDDELARIASAANEVTGHGYGSEKSLVYDLKDALRDDSRSSYEAFQKVLGDNALVNEILAAAGYDGVRYSGGQRIPMRDADGTPITHDVVAIFPDSLEKITNATSGRAGGFLPSVPKAGANLGQQAIGGSIAGAYSASQDEGATPESVAQGAVLGAVGGVTRRQLLQQLRSPHDGSAFGEMAPAIARHLVNQPQQPQGPTAVDWALKWIKALGYSAALGPGALAGGVGGNAIHVIIQGPKQFAMLTRELGDAHLATQVGALLNGVFSAGSDALKVFAPGSHASYDVQTHGQLLSEQLTNPILKPLAMALEYPGKVATALPDAIFGNLANEWSLAAEAMKQAHARGFTGQQFDQQVQKLIGDGRMLQRGGTPVTSGPIGAWTQPGAQDVAAAATAFRKYMTFQDELTGIAKRVNEVRNARPDNPALNLIWGLFTHLVMPFFPTLANSAARFTELTPFGLARKGVSMGEKGYESGVGALIGAGLVSYALQQGGITGSGPLDAAGRRQERADGRVNNATRIGQWWVPNTAFGHLAPILNMAGEISDSLRYDKPKNVGEQFNKLAGRLGKVGTDVFFLRGIGDAIDFATSADHDPATGLSQLPTRFLPWGATLRTVAQATDPLNRRSRPVEEIGPVGAAVESAKTQIPGLRQQVPATKDVLGRDEPNPRQGLGAVLPVRATREPSPILAEFRRLDLNFPQVSASKLGTTELTPAQQRQYRDSAQSLRGQLVEQLLGTDTYRKADDEGKKRLLEAATSRASAWAGQAIAPSRDREGYEFTTAKIKQDPDQAVSGYLRAVALNEQLRQAQSTRYLGAKGAGAEQLMADVRELGAFRQALGKAKADLNFVRKYGASRYAKADGAKVDPRYELLRKRVEANADWRTYFGPRVALELAG